jgi:FkbM family methyltransferase
MPERYPGALSCNERTPFTRWAIKSGALREPFVVLDIGVQDGEDPRWHLLGDHLVVHGLDPIEGVIDALRRNAGPRRHYHAIAAGDADEMRRFYINVSNPYESSFYSAAGRQESECLVPMRRLDTLLATSVIDAPDFLKVDVEGFERSVLLGASDVLGTALAAEIESNFGISPVYPESHFEAISGMLRQRHLLVFDLAFNRIPRTSFQQALGRKGLPTITDQKSAGKPATLNVLFCRDPISETDHPENYASPCQPLSVDRLIKAMIIYESHGLSDIALDTAERFRNRLGGRLDVDRAIDLLADPGCRS